MLRPKRKCRDRIPQNLWGREIQCEGFPEGVFVDHTGQPRPDIARESEILTESEFEAMSASKRRKVMHEVLKEQREAEENRRYDEELLPDEDSDYEEEEEEEDDEEFNTDDDYELSSDTEEL